MRYGRTEQLLAGLLLQASGARDFKTSERGLGIRYDYTARSEMAYTLDICSSFPSSQTNGSDLSRSCLL